MRDFGLFSDQFWQRFCVRFESLLTAVLTLRCRAWPDTESDCVSDCQSLSPVSSQKHKLFHDLIPPVRCDAETPIHQQNIFLAPSQTLLRVEYSDRPQGINERSDQTWELRLQSTARQEHWTSLTWLSLRLLTLNSTSPYTLAIAPSIPRQWKLLLLLLL